jgi:Fe-S cluster assembly protein SufD
MSAAATLDLVQSSARFAAARTGEPDLLLRARREGAEAFARRGGLPTVREEGWRYTSLQPLSQLSFEPAAGGPPGAAAALDLDGLTLGIPSARLTFVDGRLSAELSDLRRVPAGMRVSGLTQALRDRPAAVEALLGRMARPEEHPFTALNAAFLSDGALVEIDRGAAPDAPLELLFVSRAAASSPRVLIRCGEGSSAVVVETYAGLSPDAYVTNAVTEVELEANAQLSHYKVQREGDRGCHVGTLWVRQARDSRLQSHVYSLGAALARSEVSSVLAGEGGQAELHGLYVGDAGQHLDHRTSLDHASPGCSSREVYKGILAGRARGVFVGHVRVREGAQKTDASQSNRTLLLSGDAWANATPQLEILADDVKCAHGAAVGQLEEQALFYLRSRGIPLQQARGLLTHAFASEVTGRIRVEALKARVEALLLHKLHGEARA